MPTPTTTLTSGAVGCWNISKEVRPREPQEYISESVKSRGKSNLCAILARATTGIAIIILLPRRKPSRFPPYTQKRTLKRIGFIHTSSRFVSVLLAAVQVPHNTVALSYTQIWQKREYWRVFTASFAHFELMHLAYNLVGTWAMRGLEGRLGTFQFLSLVRQTETHLFFARTFFVFYGCNSPFLNRVLRGGTIVAHLR